MNDKETAAGSRSMETSDQLNGKLHLYKKWLPPLLAFAGLGFLLVFGGENWFYPLPPFQPHNQLFWVSDDLLQGEVFFSKVVQPGARLRVSGWLGSLVPAAHLRKMILYLDDKPVAETSTFVPAPVTSNAGSTVVHSWQLDFFSQNTEVSEHILTVQAVFDGHDPVVVMRTTLLFAK